MFCVDAWHVIRVFSFDCADTLVAKMDLLLDMKPDDINDLLPLMNLSKKTLVKVHRIHIEQDLAILNGHRHRIYYFSQQFEVNLFIFIYLFKPRIRVSRCAHF